MHEERHEKDHEVHEEDHHAKQMRSHEDMRGHGPCSMKEKSCCIMHKDEHEEPCMRSMLMWWAEE